MIDKNQEKSDNRTTLTTFQSRNTEDEITFGSPTFLKFIFLPALLTAFVGGMFWEINRIILILPASIFHLRNELALLFFSSAALFSATVSAFVLRQGLKDSFWDEGSKLVFYGGLLLALVFLITGLEFLFLGEYHFENQFPFFILRSILLILLIIVLLKGLRYERRKRTDTQINN